MEAQSDAFQRLWASLFSSPVHLDSALSKLPPRTKSRLARVVPPILLRPASQAAQVGIGVTEGEPWSLAPNQLASWKPAIQMARRLEALILEGGTPEQVGSQPVAEDFPPEFVAEWARSFGQEVARKLVHELGQAPPLSLRARRRVGSEALLKRLRSEVSIPVKAEISEWSPLGVRLAGYAQVLNSRPFEEGWFEIQDEGSQIMSLFAIWPEKYANLLKRAPGQLLAEGGSLAGEAELPGELPSGLKTVIDACAGAGGKTLALSDLLYGKGRVYAYDTSEAKLRALRKRATRAGLNNIQTLTLEKGRESERIAKFAGCAELVLVDAPCSGWGVLRRNPDIKWRRDTGFKPEADLPALQLRLLQEYSTLVAPGGRLVYGLCTFRESETTGVVENFLSSRPEFTAGPGGYLGPGPTDGFFMQSFTRN